MVQRSLIILKKALRIAHGFFAYTSACFDDKSFDTLASVVSGSSKSYLQTATGEYLAVPVTGILVESICASHTDPPCLVNLESG